MLFVSTVAPAMAGGWTQPKGGAYTKLGVMFTQATSVYDSHGEASPIRTLSTYSAFAYAEYGISDRFTGILYLPFFVRNTLNRTVGRESGVEIEPGAANNALGDSELGVRVAIIKKPFVLSASLTLGLPTGDPNDANALVTGDGEWNQLLKIEAGYGTSKWYVTGYVGVNNRTRGFSEEFRYEVEGGVKFWKDRLLFSTKLTGVESFKNGAAVANGMGLFANNVSYTAVTPELTYIHPKNFGFTVGVSGAFRGTNVLAAPAYTAGIFYKLEPRKKKK